jgi:hypothetical protein
MPFIEKDFVVDDAGAVSNNNQAWSDALAEYVSTGGIILLPKGKIYANQVDISDEHRGLIIQGSGAETKLINPSGPNSAIPYAFRLKTRAFGYADQVSGSTSTTFTLSDTQFPLPDPANYYDCSGSPESVGTNGRGL